MYKRKDLVALGLFCLVYISWGLTDSIQVRKSVVRECNTSFGKRSHMDVMYHFSYTVFR